MQVVAGLPVLARLRICSAHCSALTPRCAELACLRSTSLQDLYVLLVQVMVCRGMGQRSRLRAGHAFRFRLGVRFADTFSICPTFAVTTRAECGNAMPAQARQCRYNYDRACSAGRAKRAVRSAAHESETCVERVLSPGPSAIAQDSEGSLRLHLPDLRRAIFDGIDPADWDAEVPRGSMLLDRDSFSQAAKLESLSFFNPGTMTLTPDCFTGLTALASLQLNFCDLTNVPPALTALAGSLTSLELALNNDLQLASDDVATLLTLRKLRMLDLRKSSLDHATRIAAAAAAEAVLPVQPPSWSMRSVQHLVNLPAAFLTQHGHVLALLMHEEE